MNEKTSLVLLPGLLLGPDLWAHQIETLSDLADISVADLTIDDRLEDMAGRVLEQAPTTFSLAGLSMGGYVAQEIMRQAPERVERLALIDTSAESDSEIQRRNRLEAIDHVNLGEFKGVTSRILPSFIHTDRLNDQKLTNRIVAMAEKVGRESFLRQQNAILNRKNGIKDLAAITCPLLVMCGRHDSLTPLQQHRAMAAAAPTATLVIVEDCGHLAPIERPYAVSAALRYWLQS
ncbi:MAG TPA: alpha/beta hydrolase [Rhodospirillales bacterium]|nr:alpha/beta hydrolase [Rhodospirillales bacterium]